MTKKIILLLTLFNYFNLFAQSWQWAKNEKSAFEEGAVCCDLQGNVYLAGGIFSGPPSIIGSYTINTPGIKSCLVKYDPMGNVIWVNTFTLATLNTSGSWASGVYTDNNGNVFLTGNFGGTVFIGTQTLISNGLASDPFLIKFDSAGNVLWAKNASGTSVDYSWSACVDGTGNCIISGVFRSPSIVFGSYTLTNSSTSNYFLAKYDSNGNVLWARCNQAGVADAKYVNADINDNVFICGIFDSSFTVGTNTINGFGSNDYFVAKYNSLGSLSWVVSGGGINSDGANCVNIDPSGNVYVTGSYNGSNLTIGANTFSNTGGDDMFLAKYNSNGNFLWAKTAGGNGGEVGYSLASYVGGVFVASKLGSTNMSLGNFPLTTTNTVDATFFAQYNSTGNPIYVTSIDAGGDDVIAICLDNFCNLYVGGDNYNPTVTVGSNTLISAYPGTEVLFIAKFSTGLNSPTTNINWNFTICAGSSTTLYATGASGYLWYNGLINYSVIVSPTLTTNYFVIGTSSLGCGFKATQNIVVNPTPPLSLIPNNVVLCIGESNTLIANGANSYSWSNGAQINTNIITPSVSTIYSVIGSYSTTGCSATASIQVNVSGCEFIDEQKIIEEQINVYPNPCKVGFNLKLNFLFKNCVILIYNTLGEIIKTQEILNEMNFIETRNLKQGLYYISIAQDEKLILNQKLIIE